ncbi:MAG: hypothetical protein IT232_08690 [Flavobacteriales bacterium]|nr:hypothetical protein [Flavobacteriales bacterium]
MMQFLKKCGFYELLVVLSAFFFCTNYFQKELPEISADGKGYYDYLPALFIYHDLEWKYLDTLKTEYYNHSTYPGIYNIIGEKKINKYYVGTAVLISPFFAGAYFYEFFNEKPIDGYSLSFQYAVLIAAFFYLWLGLFFLRKFLTKLQINTIAIFLTQIAIVFATPIIYYIYFQPSYSHIYSFAAISMFLYFSYLAFFEFEKKHLLTSAILFGLIILIRPVNGLILLVIPFYFNSLNDALFQIVELIKSSYKWVIAALLIFVCVISIQSVFWFLQSGNLLVKSYGEERFNFLQPEIFNILFSYKKGLFLYSPFLLIVLIGGTFILLKQKKLFKLSILYIVFFSFLYFFSTWWCWWFGASFGQRTFIDILPVFAIFSSIFFHQLQNIGNSIIVILIILFSSITQIQIDQYSRYILHWESMTKEAYWKVFLKTHEKYRGILIKEPQKINQDHIIYTYQNNENRIFDINRWTDVLIIDSDSIKSNFNWVHIKADLDTKNDTSMVYFVAQDSIQNNIIWRGQFIFTGIEQHLFYKEIGSGEANFYFQIEENIPQTVKKYKIGFKTNTKFLYLNNLSVRFLKS